jgi:hypothetical protein
MTEWFDFGKFSLPAALTRFLPLAHRTLMIGVCPAAYPLGVMSMKSRLVRALDRCVAYVGLFLIGLIGWSCDRFGSSGAPKRRDHRVDSGIRHVGRFVE